MSLVQLMFSIVHEKLRGKKDGASEQLLKYSAAQRKRQLVGRVDKLVSQGSIFIKLANFFNLSEPPGDLIIWH